MSTLRIKAIALCLAGLALFSTKPRAEEVTIGLHLHSMHMPARDTHNNQNLGAYVRADGWQLGAYRNTHRRNSLYVGKAFELGYGFEAVGGIVSGYQKRCTEATRADADAPHVANRETPQGVPVEHHAQQAAPATERDCRGFSRGWATPMAALTYAPPVNFFGVRPRLWLAPGMGKASTVMHLSVEF